MTIQLRRDKGRPPAPCNWTGCANPAGREWACRRHLALLPTVLRARIEASYRNPRLADIYAEALAEAQQFMLSAPP